MLRKLQAVGRRRIGGWRNTALARDVDRGARRGGGYVPLAAWKTAPPFISRIIVNLANYRDNN
ncbi:MAG: hypothetical protein LBB47_08115 [Spirochaetaceae bacterium]|nr:hypothetical protein [Spirochaetaceae bacterium]